MKKLEGVYVADSLSNISAYADYGVNFSKVVTFLSRKDLNRLPNGRYDIDGDKAFALVQEITLKDWSMARPEVHREYFDIQLPLSGEETIGVGQFDPTTPGEFNVEKDIGFYEDAKVEPLTLRPGQFAILNPETCAHAPGCTIDGAGVVRKIVVKIHK